MFVSGKQYNGHVDLPIYKIAGRFVVTEFFQTRIVCHRIPEGKLWSPRVIIILLSLNTRYTEMVSRLRTVHGLLNFANRI